MADDWTKAAADLSLMFCKVHKAPAVGFPAGCRTAFPTFGFLTNALLAARKVDSVSKTSFGRCGWSLHGRFVLGASRSMTSSVGLGSFGVDNNWDGAGLSLISRRASPAAVSLGLPSEDSRASSFLRRPAISLFWPHAHAVEMCGNGLQYSQSLPFPKGPSHSHSQNLRFWKTTPIPVLLPITPYLTLPYLWGGQVLHLPSAEAVSSRPNMQAPDNSFPLPPIPIPASTFRLIEAYPKPNELNSTLIHTKSQVVQKDTTKQRIKHPTVTFLKLNQ